MRRREFPLRRIFLAYCALLCYNEIHTDRARRDNMTISFRPKGVCSQKMEIQVEDDKIVSLKILGGCHGNLQGISALVKGMDVDEVIAKLGGI
ncbi:MAG: TIGR03905 family TSCPD domain-containing protein, partial [Ruthenibacterium sp.]